MKGPTRYRIRVSGALDPKWSSRLGGMRITRLERPDGQTETVLEGQLMDQAALTGVINALYDLHLPVISVAKLEGLGDGE